jgi:hypothetical protein
VEPVLPIVEPIIDPVAPVIELLLPVVNPVVDPVIPVVPPVAVAPAVPGIPVIEPVVEPSLPVIEPVVPVVDASAPPVVTSSSPVAGPASPPVAFMPAAVVAGPVAAVTDLTSPSSIAIVADTLPSIDLATMTVDATSSLMAFTTSGHPVGPIQVPVGIANTVASALATGSSFFPNAGPSALLPLALAVLVVCERRRLGDLLVRIPSSIRLAIPVPPG